MGPAAARVVLAALAALASQAWAQTAPPRAPAEAYGRLPAISDAAISPDGARIALAESNPAGLTWVSVVNLDNPNERSTYGLPDQTQLRAVGWIDDGHVSFVIDRTYTVGQIPTPNGIRWSNPHWRVDVFRWGVISLESGEPRILYTDPEDHWADWGAALVAPI